MGPSGSRPLPPNTASLAAQNTPSALSGLSLHESLARLIQSVDALAELQKKQLEISLGGRAGTDPFLVGNPPRGQGPLGTLYQGAKRLFPNFGRAAHAVERSHTVGAAKSIGSGIGSLFNWIRGKKTAGRVTAPNMTQGGPGGSPVAVGTMTVTAQVVNILSGPKPGDGLPDLSMVTPAPFVPGQPVPDLLLQHDPNLDPQFGPVDPRLLKTQQDKIDAVQGFKPTGGAVPSGGSGMGALASSAGAAIKAMGGMAATGILVGVELAKLPFQLRDFGDSIMKSSQYLTEYNATIAVAFAKQEIGDVNRGLAVGRGTEDTADRLSNSLNQLKDTLVPSTIAVTNFMNSAGVALAQIGEVLAWLTGPLFEALETFGKLLLTNAKLLADIASHFKQSETADTVRSVVFTGWTSLFTSMNESLDKIVGRETVKVTDLPFGQQILEFANLPRGGGGWNGRAPLLPPPFEPLRGPPIPRRP